MWGRLVVAGVVALAIQAQRRGPPRPPRPSRRPRPGDGPLPMPVRPDRPRDLSGGAAAALEFGQ